jgi:hypothetical protein
MREGGVAGERETEEMFGLESAKVSLLTRGERSGLFCDGRDKGFVVGEEGERTTFEEETEMFGGEESGQQFPVKSGDIKLYSL